jgi:hypothetical protein
MERQVQRQSHNPDLHSRSGYGRPESVGGLGTYLWSTIGTELKAHAPYTLMGTLSGMGVMVVVVVSGAPPSLSHGLFWSFHPLHVLLSALVTTSMFATHGRHRLWTAVLVGYLGSIGIATFSDCLIPFAGEILLDLPNRGIHLGFIEKWWLVNPLALLGIVLGYWAPHTRLPHAGHVLLSTWASLFHMTMAIGQGMTAAGYAIATIFLFLAVWLPCCTSDIVFPLLFTRVERHP